MTATITMHPPLRLRLRLFASRYAAAMTPAVFWTVTCLMTLGLFGRIMTYPLGHDEEIHVAAASLLFHVPLYGTLGYNHLPGLPLLLHGFYALTGSDHLLQAGRVMIFLCWVATVVILWQIARRQTGERRIATVVVLVFMAGTLLGPAGMLVTNNLLPIPFSLLAFQLFVTGLDGERIRPRLIFAAGAAIGFAISLKISFVFLLLPFAGAALTAPRDLPVRERVLLLIVPLVAGGLFGGLPTLVALLDDPAALYDHTVRYFTGGHRAYWEMSTAPKAMSLGAKLIVAEDVWFADSGLLAAMLAGVAAVFLLRRNPQAMLGWKIVLAAAIIVCAAIVSFLPTPAFPQYYEPPVPFVIVLFLLIYRQLDHPVRSKLKPVLAVVGVVSIVLIVPRMLVDAPSAARVSTWTGNRVNAEGKCLADIAAASGTQGRVATLAPILALEAHLPTYPEFSAGPFLYRVAEFMPAADRARFRTTSPHELATFLDRDPPAAIVTGFEPEFDRAFEDYARSRGYVEAATGSLGTRIFTRPGTRHAATPDDRT